MNAVASGICVKVAVLDPSSSTRRNPWASARSAPGLGGGGSPRSRDRRACARVRERRGKAASEPPVVLRARPPRAYGAPRRCEGGGADVGARNEGSSDVVVVRERVTVRGEPDPKRVNAPTRSRSGTAPPGWCRRRAGRGRLLPEPEGSRAGASLGLSASGCDARRALPSTALEARGAEAQCLVDRGVRARAAFGSRTPGRVRVGGRSRGHRTSARRTARAVTRLRRRASTSSTPAIRDGVRSRSRDTRRATREPRSCSRRLVLAGRARPPHQRRRRSCARGLCAG